MKTSLIVALIVCFVFVSCEKSATNVVEEIPNLPEKSAKLIESDNTFGLELFSRIANKAGKNKNTTVSPLSVSLALAMTYNGARGETKSEMEKVMSFTGLTPEQINNSHKALVSTLTSADPEVVLEIANAIYYRQGFNVLPDFIATNQSYYNAEVSGLDFSRPDNVLKTINGWVAQKTHDKIPTILDQVDPYLMMVLLNAVYFNGIWSSKFNDKETHNLPFIFSDGTSKTTAMMKQESSLEFASNDLFSAVNLPYGKGQFQMTVILPNEKKTTKDVIAQLNVDNWRNWMKSFKSEKLVVTMPRFKFSWELALKDVLTQMGMKQAFSSGIANFGGISNDMDLYISSVIHKTYIDVNENGTEAAAVTAVLVVTTGMGEPDLRKYFTVNRPFLFAITEKTTGAILFVGEVTNPEYN